MPNLTARYNKGGNLLANLQELKAAGFDDISDR